MYGANKNTEICGLVAPESKQISIVFYSQLNANIIILFRCVCLGEVTNDIGAHIQLGSLQVLSFFGASRSSVIGCV